MNKNKTFAFFFMFQLLILIGEQVVAQDNIQCSTQDKFLFLKKIDNISAGIGKTTLKDGFFITPYNLKIDPDCQKRIKIVDLEKYYREAMAEGTACLGKLSTNGVGPLGAEINVCMLKLFQDKGNPPKLLCGGWPFGNDILAVGSFPGSSKRHPYLWLSPKITDFKNGNLNENKGIIFHEMLHNCGFTHSEGIEVTSTCEDCCFNKDLSDSQKNNACNICAGKYNNENDSDYVKELLAWSKDYPSWGLQNRARALVIALKFKNKESLKVIASELAISEELKRELVQILFLSDAAQSKEKVANFYSLNQTALANDKIFDLILRHFK